mgnify:CR=1 FL=1
MDGNDKSRLELVKLMELNEQELFLYDALRDKNLERFFYLLKQGYSLTPFILNAMEHLGYGQHIDNALNVVVNICDGVYDFLEIYWGRKKQKPACLRKNSLTLSRENSAKAGWYTMNCGILWQN